MTDLPAPPGSACPSLFRLAPARDGGICRIKLPLGVLSAGQARAVAAAAQKCGSGVIELTSRANLQLRGVSDSNHARLVDSLLAVGLGSKNPGAEDVRNVMVSPLAGLDKTQALDVRPLARQILATLESEPRLHTLSAKFAILIDGGEAVAPVSHPHDIWLSAVSASDMALGLAGAVPVEGTSMGAAAIVPVNAAHDTVIGLLDVLLELGGPGMRRMRDLVAAIGTDGILGRGVRLSGRGHADRWRRAAAADDGHLGAYKQADGACYVGGRPALGRLDPAVLVALGDLAAEFGAGELHVTPWQSVIIPHIAPDAADTVVAGLQELGLATDHMRPLATMIACSGATGCRSALADTQRDALLLAAALREGAPAGVHLSGCAKSCAAADAAPATLVAVGEGRYDLYARQEGESSRFGRCLGESLAIEAAAAALS